MGGRFALCISDPQCDIGSQDSLEPPEMWKTETGVGNGVVFKQGSTFCLIVSHLEVTQDQVLQLHGSLEEGEEECEEPAKESPHVQNACRPMMQSAGLSICSPTL